MLFAGKITRMFADQPNAMFVYVAARRLRDLRKKDAIHPSNVILMDQDDLARCYGPTIMSAHAMITSTARAKQANEGRTSLHSKSDQVELDEAAKPKTKKRKNNRRRRSTKIQL